MESMIRFTTGNVIDAEAEALVNTVNCVGVMGRGVALQFKRAFPANFKAYFAACQRGEVQPGRMFVFDTGGMTSPRYIINFPTKRHWRGKSRVEDIESGLAALVEVIRSRRIHSVAMPPLGSGLGGLDWNQVRPLIEDALSEAPEVDVLVFEPSVDSADARGNRSTNVPRMTAGRASLIGLMDRYLAALMDPSISLLEVHKLMYFLQEAHQPLRLRYVKAPYGPYAENLRHVLHAIEGHLVSGYADGGDTPDKQLALVPGSIEDARGFLEEDAKTKARFDRVAQLVDGFETPFGLELLATVHWIVAKDGVHGLEQVTKAMCEWEPPKRQYTSEQIRIALERLVSQEWLTPNAAAVTLC
jgi:O-acetyl-ADP-ribose deacetylase (regulator of RNase III)